MALGGTVALAGWGAVELGAFNALHVETAAAPIAEPMPTTAVPAVVGAAPTVNAPIATSANEAVAGDSSPTGSVLASAGSPAAETPIPEPVLTGTGPKPAQTGMQLASVAPSDPVDEGAKPSANTIESAQHCVTDTCIDAYLWSLYERTPKIDTVKVSERIKVTVKKKGKPRTVTQTVVKYVVDDFTWKDPAAAQHGGKSLMDYVIGGMDPGFRLKLYRALRAMDDAGLMPGITSGFRDDYRQTIATGNKAASDSSFHGGSRRGGYGHGLAADLVSVKGENRTQRYASSEELWKWIDAHDKELGIGRPYLDRDPPHVGPIDGTEYIVKRSVANKRALANAKKRTLQAKAKTAEQPPLTAAKQLAARTDAGATKHPTPANATKHPNPTTLSKLSSLQKRATLPR